METVKNLAYDFKERLCPSMKVKDIKDRLQVAFNETLEVKNKEIQDLKTEIEKLKKTRKCCFCGDVTENEKHKLTEFCDKLWFLTGYPSYYYCHKKPCTDLYIAQLENL